MECLEYIQQVKERLQMDVDQLDEILSKQFSIDIAVKFTISISNNFSYCSHIAVLSSAVSCTF